jgi:hypothetical protein
MFYENERAKGGQLLTPGQLVNAVAISLNVPAETVVQHDRNLVVAGLRTKGGRGQSAPKVTPLDAARLVTAVLGSVRIVDSVDTVRLFERTVRVPPDDIPEETLRNLVEQDSNLTRLASAFSHATAGLLQNHNFVEALAALIADATGLALAELTQERYFNMEISCEVPKVYASIGPLGFIARYAINTQLISKPQSWQKSFSTLYGTNQSRSAHGTAIMLLGRAFFENGLSSKTKQEAMFDDWLRSDDFPKKRNRKKASK